MIVVNCWIKNSAKNCCTAPVLGGIVPDILLSPSLLPFCNQLLLIHQEMASDKQEYIKYSQNFILNFYYTTVSSKFAQSIQSNAYNPKQNPLPLVSNRYLALYNT